MTSYKILNTEKAQAILEFTFAMVIIMLMMYSLIMIMRWVGMDFAERRIAHEQKLTEPIDEDFRRREFGTLKQLDPYFYKPIKMNAIFTGTP